METLDGGRSWRHLNAGLDVVGGFDGSDPRVHDPHCMRLHPLSPDRLYQQNHCGIYRLDRPSEKWVRIGRNMPKPVGDVGFPITLHPRDPDAIAWASYWMASCRNGHFYCSPQYKSTGGQNYLNVSKNWAWHCFSAWNVIVTAKSIATVCSTSSPNGYARRARISSRRLAT